MTKDVYLFDTPDGGEVNADLEIRDGLQTSVYLSLFGGNSNDDGRQDSPFDWWGNIGETVESRVYRSEAAYLLKTVAPTPNNLKRIEDGAKRDLAWMLSSEIAKTLKVTATMPGINKVNFKVFLDGIDPLEFRSSWGDEVDEAREPVIKPPRVLINDGVEIQGRGFARGLLVFRRENGDTLQVPISSTGVWSIKPYPLTRGEVATAYITTTSGLTSGRVTIIGVVALLYDGAVFYDGYEEFDGLRNI